MPGCGGAALEAIESGFEEIVVMILVIMWGVGWDGIGWDIPSQQLERVCRSGSHIFPYLSGHDMIGGPSELNGGTLNFLCMRMFSVPRVKAYCSLRPQHILSMQVLYV